MEWGVIYHLKSRNLKISSTTYLLQYGIEMAFAWDIPKQSIWYTGEIIEEKGIFYLKIYPAVQLLIYQISTMSFSIAISNPYIHLFMWESLSRIF